MTRTNQRARSSVNHHVCGCYIGQGHARVYLPQVDVKSHTTIYSTASSTSLWQTYVNPNDYKIEQLRYTFPLFDGVSVVEFECKIGNRVIKGLVKEKEAAKNTFRQAINRGETAGLLEQVPNAADVFTTTLGNVPAHARITVNITYVGELKSDPEDGIRLTIPTTIAPRYGAFPGSVLGAQSCNQGRMEITVDVTMEEGSNIQRIQSPSHPISTEIGMLASSEDDLVLTRGSASFTQGSTGLYKDFVLQIVAKGPGSPRAILETHTSLSGQRALMVTLVPKFHLESENPEIIFVVDRSGSMHGKMDMLVDALIIFIKSLPFGTRFNIISFGSHCSALWPQSKVYSESSQTDAIRHVESLQADMGGTELGEAVQVAVESRFTNTSTEIMLLTDGQITDQREVIGYLNEENARTSNSIRVFTMGIGSALRARLSKVLPEQAMGFRNL